MTCRLFVSLSLIFTALFLYVVVPVIVLFPLASVFCLCVTLMYICFPDSAHKFLQLNFQMEKKVGKMFF